MSVEQLGETIRRVRKERKMRQDELATAAGVSRATISGIENNTLVELGVRKYEKVLNVLGLTLSTVPNSGRPTLDSLKTGNFG